MILVDSSVWVDHLTQGDPRLVVLLHARQVLTHPFVVGELALGSMKNRKVILDSLRELPRSVTATDDEAFDFIEGNALFGLGIGYIDVHLLAATRLSGGSRLWTRDKRLAAVSKRLGLSAEQMH
jgi:predicted nucleic acid-binding protein